MPNMNLIVYRPDDPPAGGAPPAPVDEFDGTADEAAAALLAEAAAEEDQAEEPHDDDSLFEDDAPNSDAADNDTDTEEDAEGDPPPAGQVDEGQTLTDEEILAKRPDLADRLKPAAAEAPKKPDDTPTDARSPQERYVETFASVLEENRERLEEVRLYGDAVEAARLQEEMRATAISRLQAEDREAQERAYVQRAEQSQGEVRSRFVVAHSGEDPDIAATLEEELGGYDPVMLQMVADNPQLTEKLNRRLSLIARGRQAELAEGRPRRAAPTLGNGRAPGGQRPSAPRGSDDREVEELLVATAMDAARAAGKPITEAEARMLARSSN